MEASRVFFAIALFTALFCDVTSQNRGSVRYRGEDEERADQDDFSRSVNRNRPSTPDRRAPARGPSLAEIPHSEELPALPPPEDVKPRRRRPKKRRRPQEAKVDVDSEKQNIDEIRNAPESTFNDGAEQPTHDRSAESIGPDPPQWSSHGYDDNPEILNNPGSFPPQSGSNRLPAEGPGGTTDARVYSDTSVRGNPRHQHPVPEVRVEHDSGTYVPILPGVQPNSIPYSPETERARGEVRLPEIGQPENNYERSLNAENSFTSSAGKPESKEDAQQHPNLSHRYSISPGAQYEPSQPSYLDGRDLSDEPQPAVPRRRPESAPHGHRNAVVDPRRQEWVKPENVNNEPAIKPASRREVPLQRTRSDTSATPTNTRTEGAGLRTRSGSRYRPEESNQPTQPIARTNPSGDANTRPSNRSPPQRTRGLSRHNPEVTNETPVTAPEASPERTRGPSRYAPEPVANEPLRTRGISRQRPAEASPAQVSRQQSSRSRDAAQRYQSVPEERDPTHSRRQPERRPEDVEPPRHIRTEYTALDILPTGEGRFDRDPNPVRNTIRARPQFEGSDETYSPPRSREAPREVLSPPRQQDRENSEPLPRAERVRPRSRQNEVPQTTRPHSRPEAVSNQGRPSGSRFSCPEPYGFFPDHGQCDRYFECRNGTAAEQLCHDGLAFNTATAPTYLRCDSLRDVDCVSRPLLQEARPTAHCPRRYGLFPHETDCTKFWNCVDGTATEVQCPPGLTYHDAKATCDWADLSETSCSTEDLLGFTCPEATTYDLQDGVYSRYAHPSNCQLHFTCIKGSDGLRRPRMLSCNDGHVFDPVSSSCSDPDDVPGCENFYGDRSTKRRKASRQPEPEPEEIPEATPRPRRRGQNRRQNQN